MEKPGTKLNTSQKHELEAIIEAMGDAMRKAYFPYVAESGRNTPKMDWVLQQYMWFTMKVCDVRRPNAKV